MPVSTEPADGSPGRPKDWVTDPGRFMLAWVLPALGFAAAAFAGPEVRTVVWTAALVWMGAACLVNAGRCRRTHCHFSGPFFLIVAVAVLLDGTGLLSLGDHGWIWLGVTTAVGAPAIWWVTERWWGRFLT